MYVFHAPRKDSIFLRCVFVFTSMLQKIVIKIRISTQAQFTFAKSYVYAFFVKPVYDTVCSSMLRYLLVHRERDRIVLRS